MRYEFFTGPFHLRDKELIARSEYIHPEQMTNYYIFREGRREEVSYYDGRWHSWRLDRDVDSFIEKENPKVFSVTSMVQAKWKPVTNLEKNNSWLSIMVDNRKIVGFYQGYIAEDEKGRRVSYRSYISISPEYQGRGLCRELASFTYEKLLYTLRVDYIIITVSSKLSSGACRCYVKAAKDLTLNTFGSREEEYDYQYREVEDCNLGDLKFLIFTFSEDIDEIMVSFFGEDM
ncbi:Hypothetical protein BRZCDTV_296 [Brazilian cedratvirus IHUMI]|uniref:N-acetyltransferase domain-containing protein n=1 Tax=Brazilian cedratvirus IHUMI TaxID=2126980 RepID=A0A2R8FEH3_9VIRU|nr:Hypothetical protein BRZCDTV_296 [Brazilian cedratvirus IHUMI]